MKRPKAAGLIRDDRRSMRAIIIAASSLLACPADAQPQSGSGTAVLAGGCFWGVESLYRHVKGVGDVVSGYAGGNPSGVGRSSGDDSGVAEAVRISFDPAQISYQQLLQIFFEVVHDPTQLNRQGPDVGPKYRSAIFPQNAQQRSIAQQYLARLRSSGQFGKPVATKIESGSFEVAEPDQQDYVRKHPRAPYVVVNDLPKIAELKRRYPQLWRD